MVSDTKMRRLRTQKAIGSPKRRAQGILVTISDLIRSIRHRDDALEQIDGALRYDGTGAKLAPEDRQLLITTRLEIQKAAVGNKR